MVSCSPNRLLPAAEAPADLLERRLVELAVAVEVEDTLEPRGDRLELRGKGGAVLDGQPTPLIERAPLEAGDEVRESGLRHRVSPARHGGPPARGVRCARAESRPLTASTEARSSLGSTST